ncbi:conjugative relaxase-like TrwC/TraI family protein [Propionicimonas paludicola]|uniref:Conjugative relaxase-like TrwC/TraI family protein n=1 Tax=Propionicimonas paludicola TaxID=185243 RepID=A0A2A9CVX0_9ACTN|nr:MobF family relaxase [Propionicimonas paludicola]PFG17780.1 conjugative relaxase-like TrwC/TraI family protein [Propionicimonas paludicola]
MAIGLQKLSAGSGYEYLTRQVAALDVTGRGHVSLADYYAVKGEAPGIWWGSGLDAVGLTAGGEVTAEQMKLLFGAGLNPTTGEKLGRAYSVFAGEPTPFETELGSRLTAWQHTHGLEPAAPIPQQVRSQLRTELGREWFLAERGTLPEGPRELHAFIAKAISHPRVPVAGFDLTLSPPKSVSALWAVADPELASRLRAVHDQAVTDALTYLEGRALFTRQGTEGVRRLPVRGMIAARFVHRDSRAGDPDLHTHVAISNKVQTLPGDWLAIDASILYAAKVTISEAYTTSLTAGLRDLGLAMEPTGRDGQRPVWEIAGLEPGLLARWSSRRRRITAYTGELVTRFEAEHERLPTAAEKLDLAQQATLATRQAKHEPRSEAEQRATWQAQAEHTLGLGGLHRMLTAVLTSALPAPAPVVDDGWLARTAQRIVTIVESERSSWTIWNVRSEAFRQVRAAAISYAQAERVVDQLTSRVLAPTVSVPIATTRTLPVEPDLLLRPDGTPVYAEPDGTRYTSHRVLWAERRLVDTAARTGGRTADHNSVTLALLQSMANREPLNSTQQTLVREMATSGRRLQLAIAPAGTGKTTAMRGLATAWTNSGGNVVSLAPSAAAAEQLRGQLGQHTVADNLAKLVWAIGHHEPLADAIGPDTLVIIDEAGMADTLTLDHVISWCLDRGASIRLIGDDQQLGAIGAGGVLRDIATSHGALRLDEVLRFSDPAEADASLALRSGDVGAIGYYLEHGRVHAVDPDTATSDILAAWQADKDAGLDALMLAPTRELVAQLNAAARAARIAGHRAGRTTDLSDGNQASVGDIILTRRNNRTLNTGETAWVRNGDRWTVTAIHRDGSIDVQHLRNHNQLTLPADYVAESVELGYATTIHTAQGITADTCHGLLTGQESRQLAYTMLSRGRAANHAWLMVNPAEHHLAPVAQALVEPHTAVEILEAIIECDQAPASATTLLAQADDPSRLLRPAVTCYLDAITFAAEHHLPDETKQVIDWVGERYGLTEAAAWPALRGQLMLIAANDHKPVAVLSQAVALGGLDDAHDRAAVLCWRIDLTQASNGRTRGPLPWLPGIPTQLLDDPEWKTYLSARFTLTRKLGEEVHEAACSAEDTPRWAEQLPGLDPKLVADIQLWRAARQIPDHDLRPTGPTSSSPAERRIQRDLDHQLEHAQAGIREWAPRIAQAAPATAGDPRLSVLAARLARLSNRGHDATDLLQRAAVQGTLPDDHPADALNYRITGLIKTQREAESRVWETITPTAPRPYPEHPRSHSPDRGISI